MSFHFPAHNFSGKYHTYAASNKDLHVTFLNEPHVGLQNFSKNVNSAVCTCTVQPTYHPFSNQYYYTYSNYGNHFTDQMRYPWLPYANFLHNRNWFYPSRWRKISKQVSVSYIKNLIVTRTSNIFLLEHLSISYIASLCLVFRNTREISLRNYQTYKMFHKKFGHYQK